MLLEPHSQTSRCAGATQAGWGYDPATQTLTPKPVPRSTIRQANMQSLTDLTEFVLYLDQQ